MAREKPAYRDNLESILNFLENKYGDKRHLMKARDVQEYTGFCYNFCKREYFADKMTISAETFARALS